MVRKLPLIILLLLCASFLHAATNSEIVSADKVYIIPFEQSVKNTNVNSFDKIVFKSLYTFIGIIPALDVPDESKLQDFYWMSDVLFQWDTIPEGASPEIMKADYIIYGDYEYLDDRKENVKINLYIWNKKQNKNIFTKSYLTTTGIELFDAVDSMLADIIKGVLKVDLTLARIKFKVSSGAGSFDVLVNQRKIDTFTNGNYSRNLTVLGNQKYRVTVVRKEDGRVLLDTEKKLKSSEVMDVGFTAYGSVKINAIGFKAPKKSYSLILDDKPVLEGAEIPHVSALSSHSLKVMDDSSTVYSTNFEVVGGGMVDLWPALRAPKFWNIKVYGAGSSFGGAEAQFFLNHNLYIGPGIGFSYFHSSLLKENIYNLTSYVDAGYYLLGNMTQDLRAGAGVSGLLHLYFPFSALDKLDPDAMPGKNNKPYSFSAGLFVFAEWNWVTLKAGLNYDIGSGSFYFSPSAGVKF